VCVSAGYEEKLFVRTGLGECVAAIVGPLLIDSEILKKKQIYGTSLTRPETWSEAVVQNKKTMGLPESKLLGSPWLAGLSVFWFGGLAVAIAVGLSFASVTSVDIDTDGLAQYLYTILQNVVVLAKEQIAPLQMLMFPSVIMGIIYRTRKFASEGFHDMFSISINMFVPCNDRHCPVMAVRTLKDAPLKEFLFEDCAMEVLRSLALKSLEQQTQIPTGDCTPNSGSSTSLDTDHPYLPFLFVDMKYAPDSLQTSARFRAHFASELSALFGLFQVLSGMRVGPIVSRKFCWAITYEASDVDYGKVPRVSLKATTTSLVAMMRMKKSVKTDDERVPLADHSVPIPQTSPEIPHSKQFAEEHNPNKFRMILIELDCLRCAHLKKATDILYEDSGSYYKRRWETIRAMQDLFDLNTGRPKRRSTVLCGSVTFSAPLMVAASEGWSFAPWESWKAEADECEN
jgi:hypothetical protein